jgi:transcriptional regulator with XRE-family HTH domain
MPIGGRLRAFREAKKLSQDDIRERSGLRPSYISRVENGHTVPSVETLEKWARALEVPLYQLFYKREEPPKLLHLPKRKAVEEMAFGRSKKEARILAKFRQLLGRMNKADLQLLLLTARWMAKR